MNYDNVLQILLRYANNDDNIRALLLEGSRAFGNVDQYSDYDIVFVTISSAAYFDGKIIPFLVENFGEIAVMQTPDNGDPHDVYTHLVQFTNGIRIDLTFNSLDFLNRAKLESATVVLLDKDARFKNIETSDKDFWLKFPSCEEFKEHTNEFWWVAPYIVKAVKRNQILNALELLSGCIRSEYLMMLSYLAGIRGNFDKINLGKNHTYILKFLLEEDRHYYDVLLASYIGADNEVIISTLNLLMLNYDSLASKVAGLLGYYYDSDEAKRVIKFMKEKF